MRRSFRSQIAISVALMLVACGGASQFDQTGAYGGHSGKGGSKSRSGDAGVGGANDDASVGSGGTRSGSGGETSEAGGSGTAGTAGTAGTGAGVGGSSGNSGSSSGNGGTAGSSGAGGAPATGGIGVEVDAGSPLVDPHAEERRQLAEDYCTACSDGQPDCASKLNVEWFNDIPVDCWDELLASEKCSKSSGCSPLSGGLIGGGACLAERNALGTCIVTKDKYRGEVTGSTTTCQWRRPISGTGCEVVCLPESDVVPWQEFETQCSGPPDGPFQCWCALNGRDMSDSMILNGARFYMDTCQAAGQLLADGYCHKFVSCCYTFTGGFSADPSATACECTSDPTYGGQFKSCEDLATSHTDGKVIDICPGYIPLNVAP